MEEKINNLKKKIEDIILKKSIPVSVSGIWDEYPVYRMVKGKDSTLVMSLVSNDYGLIKIVRYPVKLKYNKNMRRFYLMSKLHSKELIPPPWRNKEPQYLLNGYVNIYKWFLKNLDNLSEPIYCNNHA